jgi:hypothetical protein
VGGGGGGGRDELGERGTELVLGTGGGRPDNGVTGEADVPGGDRGDEGPGRVGTDGAAVLMG